MPDAVGALTILEPPLIQTVESLWTRFEREFGCTAVRVFPHPNLTLQAGFTADVSALEKDIGECLRSVPPFEIRVEKIGVFITPSPTIFLRVHASDALRDLNGNLARIFSAHCPRLVPHYQPGAWVPHVTVAMDDFKVGDIGRAHEILSEFDLEYRQLASNITLVRRPPGARAIEIARRWNLMEHGPHVRKCDR